MGLLVLLQFACVCVPDGVHDGGAEFVGLVAGGQILIFNHGVENLAKLSIFQLKKIGVKLLYESVCLFYLSVFLSTCTFR